MHQKKRVREYRYRCWKDRWCCGRRVVAFEVGHFDSGMLRFQVDSPADVDVDGGFGSLRVLRKLLEYR